MRTEELLIARFAGRTDDHARQANDGRYWRARTPLTADTICRHLRGEITVAVYQLRHEGGSLFTPTGLLDFDTSDGLERAVVMWETLRARGVPSLVELSRAGRAHLWLFFASPLPTSLVRRALEGALALSHEDALVGATGDRDDGVEVFPKSERLAPDQWGNTTRLPLGLHRKCSPPQRFGFFDPLTGRAVARGWDAQVACLAAVADAPRAALDALALHAPEPSAPPAPGMSASKPHGVTPPAASNRKGVIARLNDALLARYGSLAGVVAQFTRPPDAKGWTVCPFHEDRCPSMRVDERWQRAVCYVCPPQNQGLRFATFDPFELVAQARFGGDKKAAARVLAEELFASG